jgi:hypothetical protein
MHIASHILCILFSTKNLFFFNKVVFMGFSNTDLQIKDTQV